MKPNLRIVLLAALIAASAAPAAAGPRDDAINEMLRCADMTDAAARHACFDAAIPQLKSAAQTAPVGEPPPPQTAATEPAQQPSGSDSGWFSGLNPFGGSSGGPTQQQMAHQAMGQEILPVTIGVADYSVNADGYSVTLENGQVWKNHSRLGQTPPFNMGEKNTVTIQRAMLGGFHLLLNGRKDRYRVVRVK